MLLEDLIEKSTQKPEYDWDGYYKWLFSEDAGQKVAGYTFWECKKCLTINLLYLPARYGKCRNCSLIHMAHSTSSS
ncbi:hypothetical protein GEOBRER4_n0843 [Citrifermentans bremense]|uniref:Uncharacterized protein n=1 Tax=Citrifermentans bremense TaxID=60035 RepID=A0A6S6LVW0_9BACT|nr:hypothetical protein [Citrifermentans bremense]BCG46062.1 hypothetical protein GEOBRER4_n0843 [Citrifermentans bremense]